MHDNNTLHQFGGRWPTLKTPDLKYEHVRHFDLPFLLLSHKSPDFFFIITLIFTFKSPFNGQIRPVKLFNPGYRRIKRHSNSSLVTTVWETCEFSLNVPEYPSAERSVPVEKPLGDTVACSNYHCRLYSTVYASWICHLCWVNYIRSISWALALSLFNLC